MRKKVIIFEDHFAEIGGVETHCYNLAKKLNDFYDLLVIYNDAPMNQLSRLYEVANVEKYDPNKTYECDVLIRNSLYWIIPENIKAKKYYEMLHADYEWLNTKVKLNEWNKCDKIACGEFVARQYEKVYGLDKNSVKSIRNVLDDKQKIDKIYHFISATRLAPEKGWNRMLKMMDMLRANNIKFTWDIFTNSRLQNIPEEVRVWKPRFNNFSYVADADYTVLLSDSEGLPYTIQESLQYGTPCIVTDIGGNTELIKDGVNGYVVPLDMDFDINKIKVIPQFDEYTGTPIQEWLDVIGEYEYIKQYRKEYKMQIEVLVEYNDIQLNRTVKVGEILTVSKERGLYLVEERQLARKVKDIVEVATPDVEVETADVKPTRKRKTANAKK